MWVRVCKLHTHTASTSPASQSGNRRHLSGQRLSGWVDGGTPVTHTHTVIHFPCTDTHRHVSSAHVVLRCAVSWQMWPLDQTLIKFLSSHLWARGELSRSSSSTCCSSSRERRRRRRSVLSRRGVTEMLVYTIPSYWCGSHS